MLHSAETRWDDVPSAFASGCGRGGAILETDSSLDSGIRVRMRTIHLEDDEEELHALLVRCRGRSECPVAP